MADGEWVKDTAGQVLVAQDDSLFKTLGANVGADTFTLTASQLPAHTHTYSKSATSTAASTGNTGSHTLTVDEMPNHRHEFEAVGRALYWDSGLPGMGSLSYDNTNVQYTWGTITAYTGGSKGHTHTLNSHKHTITLTSATSESVGSGASINKVQSSKVVIRWYRIA